MLGLRLRLRPDRRAVALEQRRLGIVDVHSGIGHKEDERIRLIGVIVLRQVEVVRHLAARLRILVDVLREAVDILFDDA